MGNKGKNESGSQQGANFPEDPPVEPLDEFATSAFDAMGVQVTPAIAESYRRFKALKDKIQPGRLKPAAFVTCVMLAEKGN